MVTALLVNDGGSDPKLMEAFAVPVLPGVPKYVQLRETLRSAIGAGHWKPGGRLPTETELTRITALSLGTVQRALRDLADEGVVVRTHGSGTFVGTGRGAIDEPLHLRFLGRPGEPQFLPLYPKVISVTRADQPGSWSEWLRQDASSIMRVERKLSVNREFDVYDCFYFSIRTFPEISKRPREAFDGVNLKQLLSSAIKLTITDIRQHLSFVTFPRKATRAMALRPDTQGLLVESAAAMGRGTPIYYLESFIPPNDRRLDVS